MTYRVVAVCAGNICRSPIAEAVLRRAFDEAGLDVTVSSAGTGGWHAGDPADPRAMRVLNAHGYELDHRARQFDPRWFDDVDLVLALDAENLADLRRLAQRHGLEHAHVRALRSFDPALAGLPEMSAELDVPDPYYGDDDGFESVLNTIEAATPGVVDYARIDGF
ncbi:MAG: low molecular weight protein-tyrosine-phosphatase [Actinomycetes bacterium]